jgi:hypothetical protein
LKAVLSATARYFLFVTKLLLHPIPSRTAWQQSWNCYTRGHSQMEVNSCNARKRFSMCITGQQHSPATL